MPIIAIRRAVASGLAQLTAGARRRTQVDLGARLERPLGVDPAGAIYPTPTVTHEIKLGWVWGAFAG